MDHLTLILQSALSLNSNNKLIYQYRLFWESPLGVPPGLQGGGGVLYWSSRGTYKGAPAITDKSISDPARKLKLFIEVQNPKEFFQYFDV